MTGDSIGRVVIWFCELLCDTEPGERSECERHFIRFEMLSDETPPWGPLVMGPAMSFKRAHRYRMFPSTERRSEMTPV